MNFHSRIVFHTFCISLAELKAPGWQGMDLICLCIFHIWHNSGIPATQKMLLKGGKMKGSPFSFYFFILMTSITFNSHIFDSQLTSLLSYTKILKSVILKSHL